jgi:hypothetical protein
MVLCGGIGLSSFAEQGFERGAAVGRQYKPAAALR